ncbi:MAG: methyltransferase domain-containing protein [Spirochaetaceae bacterium]|jgi:ubiquinone/menaquinone biosynthesis C-methylase UbiE|nr:methyltransferase domain-containing protein [Spirochaetaceae bacterium]
MDINRIREQFNRVARKYDENRKCFIPCFDDFYKTSVSLLKFYKKDFRHITDLGAGTGLLTMELYKLYNNARYTLIDVSKDMLEMARERFNGLNNFEFIESDYVEHIPVKECDLICSALSIHHLEDTNKIKLYKNIFKKLNNGGCFINFDQFIGSSNMINELYNEWWYDYINRSGIKVEERSAWIERKKLDKENTIKETIEMLKGSGFKDVENTYNFMKFGVIMAIK